MKYTIVIRRVSTGIFVASCPAIPECHAQGTTNEECFDNAKEALELSIEYMREKGIQLPEGVGRETVSIARNSTKDLGIPICLCYSAQL